jgi:hypothetical protein
MKDICSIGGLFILGILVACNDESEPDCSPKQGSMMAMVNDTTEWDFRHVYFRRWSETNFSESWADSSISIYAEFVNEGCVLELSMAFHNIGQTGDKQDLIKPVFEENHPSQLQPYTIFYTWNVDALTERFDLYENELAWIQLSEITDEEVKGVFQATYLYRPSTWRFWDLPDTLRFHEVPFEAVLLAESASN